MDDHKHRWEFNSAEGVLECRDCTTWELFQIVLGDLTARNAELEAENARLREAAPDYHHVRLALKDFKAEFIGQDPFSPWESSWRATALDAQEG